MAIFDEGIHAFLLGEHLFNQLNRSDLEWIISKCDQIEIAPDTTIINQGNHPIGFFMVIDGYVDQISSGDSINQISTYGPGDYFGEKPILTESLHNSSFRSKLGAVVLRLSITGFVEVLEKYSSIKKSIFAVLDSRQKMERRKIKWINLDENVYSLTKKHLYFLFTNLILPLVLLLLSIPAISYGIVEYGKGSLQSFLLICGGVLMVCSILWAVWRSLDWGNDYYVVTNQRVVWHERIIGLYDSRRETPLDTILTATVLTSQIGRILGFGDVKMNTFTGGIFMRRMKDPNTFVSFMEAMRNREKFISAREEAAAIQTALDQALSGQPLVVSKVSEDLSSLQQNEEIIEEKDNKIATAIKRLSSILKVKYEQDGEITYRKHWLLLISRGWMALLLMVLTVGFWIMLVVQNPNFIKDILSGYPVLNFLPILFGLSLLWFLYNIWDWSNDIYRLSETNITGIERKPLGKEEKKTAPLESILSIEHQRENLLGIIFNFGYVTVHVGQTEFVFRGVYNPDQVHQDIANYREMLNRKKRREQVERDRQRMVQWLTTYHNRTHPDDTFSPLDESN